MRTSYCYLQFVGTVGSRIKGASLELTEKIQCVEIGPYEITGAYPLDDAFCRHRDSLKSGLDFLDFR